MNSECVSVCVSIHVNSWHSCESMTSNTGSMDAEPYAISLKYKGLQAL